MTREQTRPILVQGSTTDRWEGKALLGHEVERSVAAAFDHTIIDAPQSTPRAPSSHTAVTRSATPALPSQHRDPLCHRDVSYARSARTRKSRSAVAWVNHLRTDIVKKYVVTPINMRLVLLRLPSRLIRCRLETITNSPACVLTGL